MQHTTEWPRAVITGCGALSPIGNSVAAFWDGLLAARCGLEPIRAFDATDLTVARAGEIKDFHPETRLSRAEVGRLERIHQFGLYAAREALADAQLDVTSIDPARMGVILATSVGGMLIGEEYQRQQARGETAFDARRLFDFPYYAAANRLARELGVRGPVVGPSIACASGTHAIGLALELVRAGQGDVFLVGGAETLCRFVVSGFNCLRATTPDTVRPFDVRRSGLLLGEGAALLVVESRDHARARGARTDIEVCGTGLAGDATHMTAPARDGAGAARAMRMALADVGIAPPDVDFISAHGTGTLYNDAMEVAALTAVFGAALGRTPVNSIKGAIGHTLAAAGSFEAIMCTQVLRTGHIPPTVNCEQPDPACGLDLVMRAPRHHPVQVALSTSSAFAGNNAAIVLRRVESGERSTRARAQSRMTPPRDSESVVITGLGVVSPLGLSVEETVRRFAAGESAIGPLRGVGLDGVRGAQVQDIPLDLIAPETRPRVGRLDRLSRLFLSAAHLAVESAALKITAAGAERCGLSFGTGFGCLLTNAEYNQKVIEQGAAAASPRLFAYTVSSAAAGEVSIALGIKGPNVTAHMGFAAGLGAMGYGFDLIRTGKADVVLAGGADALGAALVRGLAEMQQLKTRHALPFRDVVPGVYPSEGAVVAVLERRDHAHQRGARVWARIDGYAAGFEPTLTRCHRESAGIAATFARALTASRHTAAEIDLIMTSAHATVVDHTERDGLRRVFGAAPSPLLLAPKIAWGECFAAGPVLSLALATGLLQRPAPPLADHLVLQLAGADVQPAESAGARVAQARLAMVHGLCYSGPTVALIVAREE